MGPGIAATLSRGGLDMVLYDVSAEQLRKAEADMPSLQKVLDEIKVAASSGKISYESDLARAVREADFVIEAVPERLELKQRVFAELDRLARPAAILASNTSGIPITRLQEAVACKSRVVGMHWSNPPHVIPMVEVIAGEHTDPGVVERTRRLVADCGLIAVLVDKEVPGFVHNRLLYAVLREAVSLVEKGVVSPEELDKCFKWGLGLKLAVIGPMELLDVAGLDVYAAVAGYLNADLDNSTRVPDYIAEKVQAKRFGMKTGEGIYQYTPQKLGALRAERAAKLLAVRKTLEGH
ncbi:MAG: 3-hydroxybutyryl-CoA dehydrogenase [Gemmatimonadetes bacterium]|nr:MAG: 3-hydroxybutyryl-CoA dehydrogenase [Gemmatimonadota bacterium]